MRGLKVACVCRPGGAIECQALHAPKTAVQWHVRKGEPCHACRVVPPQPPEEVRSMRRLPANGHSYPMLPRQLDRQGDADLRDRQT